MPDNAIYTDLVNVELQKIEGQAGAHRDTHALHGLVALRPNYATGVGTVLAKPLRALADFYLITKYSRSPLPRWDMLEFAALQEPARFVVSRLQRQHVGLFV